MTDIPDLLTRLAHTVRDANQTITLPVPDIKELIALARIGHAQLKATEAWAAVGTGDNAVRAYQDKNLELADTLRAYLKDHP